MEFNGKLLAYLPVICKYAQPIPFACEGPAERITDYSLDHQHSTLDIAEDRHGNSACNLPEWHFCSCDSKNLYLPSYRHFVIHYSQSLNQQPFFSISIWIKIYFQIIINNVLQSLLCSAIKSRLSQYA